MNGTIEGEVIPQYSPEPPPSQAVVKAIIATKLAIGTVTKDANNPFHKYKYVPIDAYYEHVASKAAENGLTWRTNLIDLTVFSEGVDDRGRPTSILRFQFVIDLFYRDGTIFQGWQNIIILHPVQGAQTTGSALSYAEKLFMRTTFSVTTAEDDVDAQSSTFQPNSRLQPATRPGPPVMPRTAPPPTPAVRLEVMDNPAPPPRGEHDNHPALSDTAREIVHHMDAATDTPVLMTGETLDGKWDMVAEIMIQFLSFCPTNDALEAFWKNNVAAVKMLASADPGQYARTIEAFKARRAELALLVPKEN